MTNILVFLILFFIVGVGLWKRSAAVKILGGFASIGVGGYWYTTGMSNPPVIMTAVALIILGIWMILTRKA